MIKYTTWVWVLWLSCCCLACYKEEIIFAAVPDEQLELPLILGLDHRACFYDASSNSLRYTIERDSVVNFMPHVTFQEYASVEWENKLLNNQTTNNLGTVRVGEVYNVTIITKGNRKELTLSFTTLPTVRIVTPNAIVNEPKCLARLTVNNIDNNRSTTTSFIGIEIRGNISQSYPKKSYSFSFLNSLNARDKSSKALFGWEKRENWILDAAYNDPSRLRNKVSFGLWKAMNPAQYRGLKFQWVEVYLNNQRLGLYNLSEQLNAQHLNVEQSEAVLYKAVTWGGATSFDYLNTHPPARDNWEGWEQKYPDPGQQFRWQPLYDLRDWASNSSAVDFIGGIATQVDLANLLDYYIFIFWIGAIDNHGKNTYWLREENDQAFVVLPWDLDLTWGRDGWGNSAGLSIDFLPNSSLYNRLLTLNPDNFRGKLQTRWQQLRATLATPIAIHDHLEASFQEIKATNIIQIENEVWGQDLDLDREQASMESWINARLVFLDAYFSSL